MNILAGMWRTIAVILLIIVLGVQSITAHPYIIRSSMVETLQR